MLVCGLSHTPSAPSCVSTFTQCAAYGRTEGSLQGRGSCFSVITHKVHPVLGQPVEALKEEEEGEEGDEAGGEVIPEHSEGQTGLSDSVPGALDEVLEEEV